MADHYTIEEIKHRIQTIAGNALAYGSQLTNAHCIKQFIRYYGEYYALTELLDEYFCITYKPYEEQLEELWDSVSIDSDGR